jgi:hypothetical protein
MANVQLVLLQQAKRTKRQQTRVDCFDMRVYWSYIAYVHTERGDY